MKTSLTLLSAISVLFAPLSPSFAQVAAVAFGAGGNNDISTTPVLNLVQQVPVWPPAFMRGLPADYLLRAKAQLQAHIDTPYLPLDAGEASQRNWAYLNYALAALTLGQNEEAANQYLEQYDIFAGTPANDDDEANLQL